LSSVSKRRGGLDNRLDLAYQRLLTDSDNLSSVVTAGASQISSTALILIDLDQTHLDEFGIAGNITTTSERTSVAGKFAEGKLRRCWKIEDGLNPLRDRQMFAVTMDKIPGANSRSRKPPGTSELTGSSSGLALPVSSATGAAEDIATLQQLASDAASL
jgi:hypothetical protein